MRFQRLFKYDVLILVSLVWFIGKFVRYTFPPLFDTLQVTYEVSTATIGIAFTGFMVIYALMQFPSGAVADRIGSVKVIAAGVFVGGVGALVIVSQTTFALLVVGMLVIGAGTGVHKTVAIRLLARVYPNRTGRMLGIHDTFGALSGVVAPAAVVVFISAPPVLAVLIHRFPGANWRGLFVLIAGVAVGLSVAVLVRIPSRLSSDSSEQIRRDGPTPGVYDYAKLFIDPRFSAFVIVSVGSSFAHNGLVAFLPLYLSQEVGLTTSAAGLFYSVFFAVTFIQLVTGELSDRLGRYPMIVSTLGIATVSLLALVAVPAISDYDQYGPIVLGIIIATFGVGTHGFQPVRGAYLMELLPDWLAGGGLGVVRTLLMGAGALSPAFVGVIADTSGFRVAFGLLAVSMAASAIVATILWVTE